MALGLSLLYDANYGDRAAAQGGRLGRSGGCGGRRPRHIGLGLAGPSWIRGRCGKRCCLVRPACGVAAEVGDRDLELCALSMWGSALINLGQVIEGTALLDEALAGALGGEGARPGTVVFTSCLLMRSCVRGADFLRVVQWTRSLDSFIERYGCPYLHATCRASYGAVLVSTGDWPRAEIELTAAVEFARDALPAVQAEAAAFLADLRLGQGRVGEARRLLTGFEDRTVVRPVLAAAYLAAGEVAMAVSLIRRQLDDTTPLEEARLREVLGAACLATGDVAGAVAEAERLSDLGTTTDSGLIAARAARLCGRALLAQKSVTPWPG